MPRVLVCISVLLIAGARNAGAQVPDTTRGASSAAILTGVVKDEYGDPLPQAEVRVDPGGYGMRTDSSGEFRIRAPAGFYNVVFRRLGYEAADFSWRGRPGEQTALSIRLDPVPHALDTVVVRDSHDRVAGASSIGGVVLDSSMSPISGVELQLIGTGRHATSYEDGVFFFAGLAQGDYVVRARRMGFSPVNVPVKVGKGELHDLAIRLSALPHTLTTVEVTEQSGYGQSASAWQDFDRRQRWQTGMAATITRDELARAGKTTLDWALRGTRAASIVNIPTWAGKSTNPLSITTGGIGKKLQQGVAGDVCVLLNGSKAEMLPLNWFGADEVERVEVIAADNDWTGTIGARMMGLPACAPDGIHHPPYFVVWLRGSY